LSSSRRSLMAHTALAAAGFSLFLVLAQPALVYAANAEEFRWALSTILVALLPYAALATVVLVLPASVLPLRVGRLWLGIVCAAAIIAYGFGTFRAGVSGLLDGSLLSFDTSAAALAMDWAVLILLGLSACVGAWFAPRLTALLCLILPVSVLAQAMPEVARSWPQRLKAGDHIEKAISLSTESNVVVILLDTVQADIFDEAIRRNPALPQALDGFIFHPNTLGYAPTTYVSMPAIHAAALYDGSEPLRGYFDQAVRQHSFMTSLADAGYEATLFNPVRSVCPRGVDCLTSTQVVVSDRDYVWIEALRLLDVSLLRSAPLAFKPSIYNRDAWLLQRSYAVPELPFPPLRDHLALGRVADRLSIDPSGRKAVFYHLMSTHPPYFFQQDCTYALETLPADRSSTLNQTECALRQVARLLDRMRDLGVYDQSTIVLLSDHGTRHIPSPWIAGGGTLARVVGSANPTLVVKAPNASGPLRTETQPHHISQVGMLVCTAEPRCLDHLAAGHRRQGPSNIFTHYVWQHEFWASDFIDGMVRYTVDGPMFDRRSWMTGTAPCGWAFNEAQNDPFVLAAGWSPPEPWGTWSNARKASLYLPVVQNGHTLISLDLMAFTKGGPVGLTIQKDGVILAEASFTQPDRQTITFAATSAPQDRVIELEFEIEGATSPAALGLSGDERLLGIGLLSVRLDEDESQ
jgi:hypothetical protein